MAATGLGVRRVTTHTPTARQVEVAEAARLHGSAAAAATHLGVSRQTVETTLARYHLEVCDARIEELEAELERLRERDETHATTSRLEVVLGRLEKLAVPVSHRRLSDGGERVKDQRQRAKHATGAG